MEQRNYAYPAGTDAYISMPLSNLAVEAFASDDSQFIAQDLLPEISVPKQSGKYYIIEKGEFLRTSGTGALRAPKAKARRVEFSVSCDSYFADNYALASEIALEDMVNADAALALRENSVRLVANRLRIDQEIRVANLVTSISNVGSGVALSGTNKWSDPINSDPIGDINTGHAFIRGATGLTANTLVLDWDTLQTLRRHQDIIELFKYTSGGELTDAQLQSVFKVDRVLVGKGIKNGGNEGAATSMTNIWGNTALLAYVGPTNGMQSATFGARFRWQNPIYPANFGVKTNVENKAGEGNIEIVEAGYYQDEKVIAREFAYAITGTL